MLRYLIDAIKSEKKLSFKHWRYRLLHWTFNVKNPPSFQLPHFLYTHYCPLFHLTNILLLCVPFTLAIKMFIGFLNSTCNIVNYFGNIMDKSSRKRTIQRYLEENNPSNAVQQKLFIINYIKNNPEDNLDEFFRYVNGVRIGTTDFLSCLDNDKITEIWNGYKDRIEKARIKAELKRKLLRERITQLVNISQVFIKLFINLVYIALFCGIIYVLWHIAIPVWECLKFLVALILSIDILSFIQFLFSATMICISALIISLITIKIGQTYVTTPLKLVGKAFEACLLRIYNANSSIMEFIAVFYEENCPPIIIVSDEESKIEEEEFWD